MARTYRRRDPGLVKAIKDRMRSVEDGSCRWTERDLRRYFGSDPAILRGQDGAIKMDKCQDANIDNEGGFKLNGHDWTYFKNNTREVRRKRREAGKNHIRSSLRVDL